MLVEIDGRGFGRFVIECPQAVEHGEQRSDRAVDLCFVDPTVSHRVHEVFAVVARGCGHLEIEAGLGGTFGGESGVPVGDDESFETPFAAEQVVEQPTVLGVVSTVESVVRRHDPERATFSYGVLEWHEVHLAQSSFVDDAVDGHAFELGVVADEVLHRRGHAVRLDPADVGSGEFAAQQRIFRVALEVSTSKW